MTTPTPLGHPASWANRAARFGRFDKCPAYLTQKSPSKFLKKPHLFQWLIDQINLSSFDYDFRPLDYPIHVLRMSVFFRLYKISQKLA